MSDVPLRPVLRSEELPWPASAHAQGLVFAQTDDASVPQPEFREIDVEGRPVLLTRLPGGQVIAFAAYCPHQGAPLRHASIDGGLLRCQQHKYVYDPHTGRNVMPTSSASPSVLQRLKPGHLPTYRVDERDGWVWVAASPDPPPANGPAAPEQAAALQPPWFPEETVEEEQQPGVHPPVSLDVRLGEEFELDLPTRPRPSHLWRVDVEGEAVEVLGQRLDAQPDGVHYRVGVVARAAGTAQVRCVYAKPWGGELGEVRTFTVQVGAG